jgi:hypothetical protein
MCFIWPFKLIVQTSRCVVQPQVHHLALQLCVFGPPGVELTQEQLVQMAFAGDDVAADFAAQKAAEAEEDAPKTDAPTGLPGWGSWANPRRMERDAAEAATKLKRSAEVRLHCLTALSDCTV